MLQPDRAEAAIAAGQTTRTLPHASLADVSGTREKAIELYNKGVEAWEEAKSAADAKKSGEESGAQMIRQSASLDPTFAEPLIMLSSLAMKSQNWAEASRYSEDLIRIDPNDIDAIRTALFQHGDHAPPSFASVMRRDDSRSRSRHHRLHRRARSDLLPKRDLSHGESHVRGAHRNLARPGERLSQPRCLLRRAR